MRFVIVTGMSGAERVQLLKYWKMRSISAWIICPFLWWKNLPA